jgi:hypothetical protein
LFTSSNIVFARVVVNFLNPNTIFFIIIHRHRSILLLGLDLVDLLEGLLNHRGPADVLAVA